MNDKFISELRCLLNVIEIELLDMTFSQSIGNLVNKLIPEAANIMKMNEPQPEYFAQMGPVRRVTRQLKRMWWKSNGLRNALRISKFAFTKAALPELLIFWSNV